MINKEIVKDWSRLRFLSCPLSLGEEIDLTSINNKRTKMTQQMVFLGTKNTPYQTKPCSLKAGIVLETFDIITLNSILNYQQKKKSLFVYCPQSLISNINLRNNPSAGLW